MEITNKWGTCDFSENMVFGAHDFVMLQRKKGKPTKFYWLVRKFANFYGISAEQSKVLSHHVLGMAPELID